MRPFPNLASSRKKKKEATRSLSVDNVKNLWRNASKRYTESVADTVSEISKIARAAIADRSTSKN